MINTQEYTELLRELIRTPSPSGGEENTAAILENFLKKRGVDACRYRHNVWAVNRAFDLAKPTVLLNSHHDTVLPNGAYTRDPYAPDIEDGILFGLGSNDAGASVVSLTAAFLHFWPADADALKYNLCLAITAEEENSGPNGLECLLPVLEEHGVHTEFAIVGEPTQMQLAIAERGLMVVDCTAHGRAGHAARNEGENAIYKALKDIEWFRDYKFPLESGLFGAVKMSVTMIQAGTQHNVVPDTCRFTVDVRVTDRYTNEQVLDVIKNSVSCDVQERSLRLRPSYISPEHPIVQAGLRLGRTTYGSPTTSDQALLSVPSLKMGPGDSARSHTADEYIRLGEIEQGIGQYIEMLGAVI